MKISLNKNIEDSNLFYILIAFSCMNFLGRGSLLFLVFALFAFIKESHVIKVDGNFCCVALLTFSIALTSLVFYDATEVVKSLNYVLLYLAGHNGFMAAKDKLRFAKKTVFSVFAGFAVYVILTYLYNRNIELGGSRIIYNVWTKELVAVTLVGLLSSVIIGYSFYAIFIHKRLWMKCIGIVSLIIMFLLNFRTATRTPVVLFLIIYSVMLLVYMFGSKWTRRIKWLLGIVIIIGLIAILFSNNVFGMRDFAFSTAIFERFSKEGVETPRTEIAVYYFKNMFDSLWGGNKIYAEYGKVAHTYIQEGHDKYGILATVALLGLTINCLRNIVKLLFFKNKKDIDFLFISMYVAMMIQMCLEPVFDGYPVAVMSLFMIHGLVTAYLSKRDELSGSDIN